MYYMTRLSKPSIDFISRVSNTSGNRTPAFALAAAYVVSSKVALPSAEVVDITQYYRLQSEVEVMRLLGILNELLPFDFRLAKEAALAFYRFRHRCVNPLAIPLAFHQESAIEDFFGISSFFSNDTLDVIRKSDGELTRYINALVAMFIELCESNRRGEMEASEKDTYVAP